MKRSLTILALAGVAALTGCANRHEEIGAAPPPGPPAAPPPPPAAPPLTALPLDRFTALPVLLPPTLLGSRPT